MAQLRERDKAPEFRSPASNGEEVGLKDFLGKERIILYFYPKDDTPGCTVEACGFRDKIKEVRAEGAVVLGVSPDGIDSHNRFIRKFNLPFLLLSDEKKAIARSYGVWVKKSLYGKEYLGIERSSFCIGRDGRIEKIYRKVKPQGHPEEILEFLRSRQSAFPKAKELSHA